MTTEEFIDVLIYHFGNDTDFGPGRTRKDVALEMIIGQGVCPYLAEDIVDEWLDLYHAND